MEFGLFMMPLHPPHRPLQDTIAENTEKALLAEQLGFDELWVGEHFSATTEPLCSPLMFLASLLPQAKRMKLGTGVVNLPNHHPAIVASEAAMFDHMSNGRLLFGIGPGGLASDFELFGNQDPQTRGEKMLESIDMILRLWTQDPPYRIAGKYWDITLAEAIIPELGIGTLRKPLQQPHPPVAMSAMSPFSGSVKTAAMHGWSPISANFIPEYSVASHWQKYLEGCAAAGRQPDGRNWRVARNIVIAPTDAEARDRAFSPESSTHYYFRYLWEVLQRGNYSVAMKPDPKMPDAEVSLEMLIDSIVIHGSPRTVTEKLVALRERVGPFGNLLLAGMDWSGPNRAWEQESMRLLAQSVMPALRGQAAAA
ncbi:LLM class flavin-dependent oxidoreductase [Roseomonas sp. E05]|uniref:LLM class flavin-dependent oxidoreductase n=1 Tax=Roseomonas sp. E05 TaxID=3046310 RepID=UPI0024BBC512|nr:LLM class flavin-dependent oxidoreductase [Roseomonas sp. E05]MDJ0386672.1 LLM class flavin-dependent oxidoreductase [Roseomonas sp. E05]